MSCALLDNFPFSNYTEFELTNKLRSLSRESILDLIKKWNKNANFSIILESAQTLDKKYTNKDSKFIGALVKMVLQVGLTVRQWADLERTIVVSNIAHIDEWSGYKIHDEMTNLPTEKYISKSKLQKALNAELFKRSKAFYIAEQDISNARLKMLSVLIFDNYLEVDLEKTDFHNCLLRLCSVYHIVVEKDNFSSFFFQLSSGEGSDDLVKNCLVKSLSKSSQLSAKQIMLDGRNSSFVFSELYEIELQVKPNAYHSLLNPYIRHKADVPLNTTNNQESFGYPSLSYFFKHAPADSETRSKLGYQGRISQKFSRKLDFGAESE